MTAPAQPASEDHSHAGVTSSCHAVTPGRAARARRASGCTLAARASLTEQPHWQARARRASSGRSHSRRPGRPRPAARRRRPGGDSDRVCRAQPGAGGALLPGRRSAADGERHAPSTTAVATPHRGTVTSLGNSIKLPRPRPRADSIFNLS